MLVTALHLAVVYALMSHSKIIPQAADRRNGIVNVSLYGAPRPMQPPSKNSAHTLQKLPITTEVKHGAEQSSPVGTALPQPASDQPLTAAPSSDAVSSEQTNALSSQLDTDYQQALFAHIRPFLHYPEGARADHARGVVDVMFSVDRNGSVLGAWVKRSSGSTALDQEAVAAVVQAQPLPPVPNALPAPLNIEWPISFDTSY